MPAPKFTQCGGYSAEELFAYGNYLVPAGHALRPQFLRHFPRAVIDHRSTRLAKMLRTPEFEMALSVAKDTCGKVLLENLVSGASKLVVHESLVLFACTTKGFVALVPVFQRSAQAKDYAQAFIDQCADLLEERKTSGMAIPAIEHCVLVAGEPLGTVTKRVLDCGAADDQLDIPGHRQINRRSRVSGKFAQVVIQKGHHEYYLDGFRGANDDLAKLCHVCEQQSVLGWREGLPSDSFEDVVKLGEGTYGEVFKTKYNGHPVAIKIMPFTNSDGGYTDKVNGEPLKSAALMLPELLITRELSNLVHGPQHQTASFIGLEGACVVRGEYPVEFLDAWDRFDQAEESYNERPDQYGVEGQLFLCVALQLGGSDLESYKIEGLEEATSIVLQTMWALRVAEEQLEFEHRDLHVGNVLVQKTEEQWISFRVGGVSTSVKSCGVKAHLIDYTLSRMRKAATTIFYDASADPTLFTGPDEPQFQCYRLMREENKDDWAKFCPRSNVIWGHYLSQMCISNRKFNKRTSKKERQALQRVFDRMLDYDTIANFVVQDEVFSEVVLERHVREQ